MAVQDVQYMDLTYSGLHELYPKMLQHLVPFPTLWSSVSASISVWYACNCVVDLAIFSHSSRNCKIGWKCSIQKDCLQFVFGTNSIQSLVLFCNSCSFHAGWFDCRRASNNTLPIVLLLGFLSEEPGHLKGAFVENLVLSTHLVDSLDANSNTMIRSSTYPHIFSCPGLAQLDKAGPSWLLDPRLEWTPFGGVLAAKSNTAKFYKLLKRSLYYHGWAGSASELDSWRSTVLSSCNE